MFKERNKHIIECALELCAQHSYDTFAMSKALKIFLVCVYTALLIQLLRLYFGENTKHFVELKYQLSENTAFMKLERLRRKNINRTNVTEALKAVLSKYQRPIRLPTDLKYILKYTQAWSHYTSSIFPNGQQAFINDNCTYINCFLTNDITKVHDFRNFDAVIFDVENNWDPYPELRAAHQNFIFTASESADNYPMCHEVLDNMYNLTWTYRLDSDIRWSYITILDKKGRTVGPSIDMKWLKHENMYPVPDKVIRETLSKKTKSVAWFVSNCIAKSNREQVAKKLSKALEKYNKTVDIYGWCGTLQCPRDRIDECLKGLEKQYHFYLAFENSLSEDYVTEKILYPLQHWTVPIVFGGANYSRFLPPDSYLDAMVLDAEALAFNINYAMTNKEHYYEYFRWRNHYDYTAAPIRADVCTLCELLNERKTSNHVKNFRRWWNPQYEKVCGIRNLTGLIQEFHYV